MFGIAGIDWIGRWQIVRDIFNSDTVKGTIIPFLYAVVTGAVGIMGGVPLMWVFMAVALAFAGIMTTILRSSEYMERTRIDNKLSFAGLSFAMVTDYPRNKKTNLPTPNSKPYVSGIRVSFNLNNAASFPIHVKVKKVSTRLDGRVPVDDKGKPITTTIMDLKIDPRCGGFVNDAVVSIETVKAIKGFYLLEGDFEYALEYGKTKNNCNFPLSGKYNIRVYLNNPPQLPIFEWHNFVEP